MVFTKLFCSEQKRERETNSNGAEEYNVNYEIVEAKYRLFAFEKQLLPSQEIESSASKCLKARSSIW
jgi:hypothetical protein